MLTKIRTCTATLLLAAFMVGCATPYQSLPVRTGTVTETQQSLRKVFQPSAGGAAAGAAVGGVVGHQIGKGNGRKVATALGVLGGILVFGFIGIFLGPVLLALGHMLLSRWTREEDAA